MSNGKASGVQPKKRTILIRESDEAENCLCTMLNSGKTPVKLKDICYYSATVKDVFSEYTVFTLKFILRFNKASRLKIQHKKK